LVLWVKAIESAAACGGGGGGDGDGDVDLYAGACADVGEKMWIRRHCRVRDLHLRYGRDHVCCRDPVRHAVRIDVSASVLI
jgi:hypothetical protein